MVNLSRVIAFHARRDPERTALVYEGRSVSYALFLERIERMAGLLAARGIGEGRVVAALMKNSPAFLDLAFAVSHLGAVFLPVNFRLSKAEVSYILEHAGAGLVVADEELAESLDSSWPSLLLDEAALQDSLRLTGGAERAALAPRKPGDLVRLIYTSGTTDRPKGVMHSYDNLAWKSADHIAALGMTEESRLLVVGPLYHVGAFDLPGIAVFQVGGSLHLTRDFDAAHTLALIERERITCAWLAPVMLSALLACESRERYDLSSVEWILGGGERTPEVRVRAFGDLFPKARYIDSYGLTETCSGDVMMERGRELEKIGSVGRPLAHVAVEIRDEAGAALRAGQEGEICLRGPKVTEGYLHDAEKTRAAFFGDWFRTGDIGYLDPEGFLYLTDRKKDMIISGGENIASSEVERVIYMLPEIHEVAVIGVPDAKWGESPAAVAVLEPGAGLDLPTLTAHCRLHLAGFKVPKALILRDALPRNPSGKILKRSLRAELAAEDSGEA